MLRITKGSQKSIFIVTQYKRKFNKNAQRILSSGHFVYHFFHVMLNEVKHLSHDKRDYSVAESAPSE
jgi:hypothetical protein